MAVVNAKQDIGRSLCVLDRRKNANATRKIDDPGRAGNICHSCERVSAGGRKSERTSVLAARSEVADRPGQMEGRELLRTSIVREALNHRRKYIVQ